MFDAIAPRYDLLNTVLSAGLDRYWRRRAIRRWIHRARDVLDVCTGTGDVALGGGARRDAREAGHRRRLRGRDAGAGVEKVREGGLRQRHLVRGMR